MKHGRMVLVLYCISGVLSKTFTQSRGNWVS